MTFSHGCGELNFCILEAILKRIISGRGKAFVAPTEGCQRLSKPNDLRTAPKGEFNKIDKCMVQRIFDE